MKQNIESALKYYREHDREVLTILDLCMIALLLLGLALPEKKKRPALLLALGSALLGLTLKMMKLTEQLCHRRPANAVVEEHWSDEQWAEEAAMWPADEDLVTGMADPDEDPDAVTDADLERPE